MRVLRFMSAAEAVMFMTAIRLENRTNHKRQGNSTDSVGFCFAVPDSQEDDDQAIYRAALHLSGISPMHICLIGELTDAAARHFKKGYGLYSSGKEPEASSVTYEMEDFKTWSLYAPRLEQQHPLMPIYSANYEQPHYMTGGGNV